MWFPWIKDGGKSDISGSNGTKMEERTRDVVPMDQRWRGEWEMINLFQTWEKCNRTMTLQHHEQTLLTHDDVIK